MRLGGADQEWSVRMYWARSKVLGSSTLPWLALPRSCVTEPYSFSTSQARSSASMSCDLARPAAKQRRCHGHDVRADHEGLHRVLTVVDARGRGDAHARSELRPEDGRPAQRQAQLRGVAEGHLRHHRQLVEVDVGLVEAVEEHEAVGARLDDPAREVGEGRVVGAQLHRQGQGDRGAHGRDELEVLILDVDARACPVHGDAVEVQLQGIGAGIGHEPRIADPAAHGVGVQAADDGHASPRA